MDDENNGQALEEQNVADKALDIAEQVQDTAQDVKQGVTDGANLAKDAATGNILGIAKDAFKLLNNKTVRRTLLIAILIPIIVIVALASSLFSVFDSVGDAVQTTLDSIIELFDIAPHKNDGVIEISNDAIDAIIESIENLGISLDDLHLMGDTADYNDPDVEEKNKEALRKYIRKFYEAQMVTQTLYTTPSGLQKLSGKTYGTVYVQRTTSGDSDLSSVKDLEYISYEKMVEKVSSQDADIVNYFSIDDDDKLVIATSTQTIIEENGTKTSDDTVYSLQHIDYKSVISQYTTPMNFFIYLTLITQNPEFVSAVADLAMDSEIVITLMDKVTTNITEEERNYTFNRKAEVTTSFTSSDIEGGGSFAPIESSQVVYYDEERTETKKTTIITTGATPAVTYAKTWFSEQTIGYIKTNTDLPVGGYETDPINEDEPDLDGESEVTWVTNDVTTVTTSGSESIYNESTRGDVIDKTGERGDGEESFIGLLDVKFKIPNTTHEESAGGNLVSGAEMFFYLLEKDSSLQNLENVMRYALYKYTGKSYGVTEWDFSVFDAKSFITTSSFYGTSTEDKFWYALKQLGYSDEAICGAMGNIYCESGFSASALNSSSGAYGLAQWMGERRISLQNYATSKGTTEADTDTQIEFLIAEITGEGDAKDYATRRTEGGRGVNYHTYSEWESAETVEDAAVAFCWFFETPSTSATRTSSIIVTENARIAKAEEYYEEYKNRGTGGTYSEYSDGYGVIGYYTSSSGRTFTILDQTDIDDWDDKCNRAACAIIASGFTYKSSIELINDINNAKRTIDGAIPGADTSYWGQYGLKLTNYESYPSDYETKLKNQLLSGGYALIWLNIGGDRRRLLWKIGDKMDLGIPLDSDYRL